MYTSSTMDNLDLADDAADTSLVSIQPQMLHEAVVAQLSRMIIEGALAPGTRLNERMLCDKLGVSRTPLREAFRVLAAQGLVALLPNRGAVVPELDEADIAETFEVIAGLEAMSGELACARVTDEEVSEIRALHYEMLACHAVRDLPGYYRLNRRIHDAINRAAGNSVLRQTYTTINSRLQALRFRSNFDRDKWDTAVREHSEMIEALDARDGARLAAILRTHVLAKCACVLAQRALAQEARAKESETNG
jgi:DNA-binding GntR family transcriptional regulator